MSDLENRLRERDTAELQQMLYRNEFSTEASPLAVKILRERGANIPEPMSEEEMASEGRGVLRKSNLKFLIFIFTIVGWFIYASMNDLFQPGNEEILNDSIKYFGIFLAIELGWIKFG